MRQSPRIIPLLLLCAAISVPGAEAQNSPSNLIRNGNFDSSYHVSNLWYGVDSLGYLSGNRGSVPVLTGGSIQDTAMPVSVAVADMNGDGLQDVIAMDPLGYLRVYFNSGSKTEPKFSIGELVPVYVSRPSPFNGADHEKTEPAYMRLAPHIAVTKMLKSGKDDLIIGNYEGDIMLLPNAGSAARPLYTQPADISQLLIPTTKDKTKRWGNLLAPCTWDWTGKGKEDLLVGEGSYSANNVHLLINQGTGATAAFDESQHYQIAFGDGKQQLSPCVVDYNGNGNPDLLVADRSGHVGVYLNKGGHWKPGVELPFDSYIGTNGDSSDPLSFGGICTVAVGDMTGGGLFDLVVGTTSGRISLAKNTGTKTAPKFSAPTDLNSDHPGAQFALPSAWALDSGLLRGNFYGYLTVVAPADDPDAKAPDGKPCLKAGYVPPLNKIMAPALPANYLPGLTNFDPKNLTNKLRVGPSDLFARDMGDRDPSEILRNAPGNFFMVRQPHLHLKVGGKYHLSLKIKGEHVADGQVILAWRAEKFLGEGKVTRGDRGSFSVKENKVIGTGSVVLPISASTQWSELQSTFTVDFSPAQPLMKDVTDATAFFEITFSLAPGQGTLYIADVTLTPQ